MIATLACFLTGAILLVEQEVEGIVIGRPNPLTGEPYVNFRNADLDGDGLQDILLPDRLLLQRSGEFPPGLSVPLPRVSEEPEYDIFGGKLYLLSGNTLEIYRLKGRDWTAVDTSRIDWPHQRSEPGEETPGESRDAPQGKLGRYLYDFSGDGVPEILIPTPDGLQLYENRGTGYRPVHTLEVYPPPIAVFAEQAPIWPAKLRAVSFPMSRLRFRLLLDAPSLTVFSSSTELDSRVRHRVTRWSVDRKSRTPLDLQPSAPFISEPLPAFLQPCRLNPDDTPDFAGIRSEKLESSLVPERVNEIIATTDGGKTIQTFRSKSFQSLCAFVDVDGDGRRDAIVESTGLFRGGLREFLVKSLGERTISHTLAVHLQDDRGVFSRTPDLRQNISITLSRPPFRRGKIFDAYQNGESINITGDIDGDGKRDLVVRTHPDRLGIFLNVDMAFSRSPDRSITITEHDRFGVADVDGDGRTDIVVYSEALPDSEEPGRTLVYFSRSSSP